MPAREDRGDSGWEHSGIRVVASDHDGFAGDAVWFPSMQVCWQKAWEAMGGDGPAGMPWLTGTEEMSMRAMSEHPYDAARFVSGRLRSYAGLRDGLEESLPVEACRGDDESGLVLYASVRAVLAFEEGFALRDGTDEQEGEWTFGSEWHGNVAHHVTYAYADTLGQIDQVFPLLYDDFDRNAVAVGTPEGDLVVLAQGLSGVTVAELWEDLVLSAAAGDTDKVLHEGRDSFEFPVLSVSTARAFPEWTLGELETHGGEPATIGCAVQAIDMAVDAEGVRAGDGSTADAASGDAWMVPSEGRDGDTAAGRGFAYTDDFVMFLVDGNTCGCFEHLDIPIDLSSAYPYLAVSVHDIAAFQDGAERLGDYDPMWGVDIDTGNTVVRTIADVATDGTGDSAVGDQGTSD